MSDRGERVREDRMVFASTIRAARAALGWSQGELATKTGVGKRSIIRIEQGEVDARRSTALAIEEIFRTQGLLIELKPGQGFTLTVPLSSLPGGNQDS